MLAVSHPTSRTFENEIAGVAGSMMFAVDEERGILRVRSSGFWSIKQIGDYFDAYNACVRRLHRNGLDVASICDLREASTQTQAVTERLYESIAGVYRPGDRVAMVVANSLVKMQMRRILDGAFHEFFLSMTAGETWALANKQG